jgi:outer membrane lipoprotein-sorting protein
MKSLPRLPLAAFLSAVTVCAWISLSGAYGQDANTGDAKPSTGPPSAKPAGSELAPKGEDGSAKEKPSVARRNEKSGASGQVTLESARDRLISYRSVQAEMVETVDLGLRRFRMKGSYLQGTDLKLRLEYDLLVGNTAAHLIEVCDGQILWTHQTIGADERVTRRNVRQILTAASSAGKTPQNLLTAELGLGGLPGLLAGIQKSVQLEKQWEQDVNEQTFVVIEGGWKKSFRSKFLGKDAPADQPLPAFVPDQVRIYFEQESLFPRRILYLKRSEDGTRRPMVTLDFVDVRWDVELAEDTFNYTPPEKVARQDVTQAYINRFAPPKQETSPEATAEQPATN